MKARHKRGTFVTSCPHCGSDNWNMEEEDTLIDKGDTTIDIELGFLCLDCDETFDQRIVFKLGDCLFDDADPNEKLKMWEG
jgi:hypothetical protein